MVPSVANASTSRYVSWDAGPGLLPVFVSTDTIAEMQSLLSGGGVSRLRESGGVLFGRTEQTVTGHTVWIDGFAPFESEHVRGASWTLSNRDRKLFARALQKWEKRGVVGWFRTHTRPGLFLDQHDFALFSDFFPHPSAVALVIRAGAGVTPEAGFFVWEDGDMRRTSPYKTFSFEPRNPAPASAAEPLNMQPGTGPRLVPLPVRPPRQPMGRAERVSSAPAARSSWGRKALFAAPVAAGLAAGIFWNPEITPNSGSRMGSAAPQPLPPAARRTVYPPARQTAVAPAADAVQSSLLEAPVESAGAAAVERPAGPAATRSPARAAVQTRSRRPEVTTRRLRPPARRAALPQPQIALASPDVVLTSRPAAVPAPFGAPHIPSVTAPEPENNPSAIRRAVGSIPGLGFLKKKKKKTATQ